MRKQKVFGIFEGGGVKGTAHAGAYEAFRQNGNLDFVGLAGTSAGSIVAALIAVGATPEFLRERMLEKDFREFLDDEYSDVDFRDIKKVATALTKGSLPRRLTAFALISMNKRTKRVLNQNGLHSGDRFVSWFRAMLAELCGDADITFKKLTERQGIGNGLKIIATNITKRALTVFSSDGTPPFEGTPDVKVWEAVRASMGIPFVFKPFAIDGELFVDGGLLSNFPAWVFDAERRSLVCAATVGFRLREAVAAEAAESFGDFVLGCWETSVAGDDHLQYRGIYDLVPIDLPNSGIDWLAWNVSREQKKEMYNSARNATRAVLEKEFWLLAEAPRIEAILEEAAKAMAEVAGPFREEPGRKRIRVNIMVANRRKTHRKVTFSFNMEGDSDEELELEIAQGANAEAWETGRVRVADLREVRERFAREEPLAGSQVYNMTTEKQDQIPASLNGLLSVPVATDSGRPVNNSSLKAVLNFDSHYSIEEMKFESEAARKEAERWARVFAALLREVT